MLSARICVVAATAATLFAGAPSAVAAPSVSEFSHFDDGSFETPVAPANTFQSFGAGASIGPWRVVSGTVDLIGAGFWQAAEGNQSLDLDGSTAGTVAQTFTTVPGTQYTVTYSIAGNPDGAPPVKAGNVFIDGQQFQDFTFDITGKTRATMGYVTRQVTFVANNSSTTLAFASTSPGYYGVVVDDVRVKACTPCPSCG